MRLAEAPLREEPGPPQALATPPRCYGIQRALAPPLPPPLQDRPALLAGLWHLVDLDEGDAGVAARPRDLRGVGARREGDEDRRVKAGGIAPGECPHRAGGVRDREVSEPSVARPEERGGRVELELRVGQRARDAECGERRTRRPYEERLRGGAADHEPGDQDGGMPPPSRRRSRSRGFRAIRC